MDYQPEPTSQPASIQAMRDKASLPGIFLIVVGVLNLLVAAAEVGLGVFVQGLSEDKIEQFIADAEKNSPDAAKQLRESIRKLGSIEEAKRQVVREGFVYAAGHGILAFLTIFGGLSMMQLRRYGLAMAGALLASIPCVSPMGCCLIGEVVGIWALLVLFNSDVSAAFKVNANPLPPEEGMIR